MPATCSASAIGCFVLMLGAFGCGSGDAGRATTDAELDTGTGGASTAGAGAGGGGGSSGATGGAAGASGSSGSGANSGTSGSGGSGAVVGPACPGIEARAEVPGATCRSTEDCQPGAVCSPEPFTGCGAQLPATRSCENDEECPTGQRCVQAEAPEPCSIELATRCEPACTPDSCAAGERCVEGLCEPTPCTDGFSCPDLFTCAPERVGADAHGCALKNCNEGYVCGAGFACDAGTGSCLAVHCREGGSAACATNQVCSEQAAGRGCVPKSCEVDDDCDCGVCLHNCSGSGCPPGSCAARLSVCAFAVP